MNDDDLIDDDRNAIFVDCDCEHDPEEHDWMGCTVEGCLCDGCWEE